MHPAAQVIDQYARAARSQRQRMRAPQTAACSGHDGHSAFEIQLHCFFS